MLRHACSVKLERTVDTRALQAYLGHRNFQNTTRYTALAPDRVKGFWRNSLANGVCFDRKPKLSDYQRRGAIRRRGVHGVFERFRGGGFDLGPPSVAAAEKCKSRGTARD